MGEIKVNPNPEQILRIAEMAGNAIMDVYKTSFRVETKDDRSPLTEADRRSHSIITGELKQLLPKLPVLSEEGAAVEFERRSQWERYWLVDPLDGTKEFIKKNGEFTVNIALMENGKPILGVITAPAKNEAYWGFGGFAFKLENGKIFQIQCSPPGDDGLVIVQSRSHASPENDSFLSGRHVKRSVSIGSSLKLCLVAEGSADVYPRFGPVMEWDLAAGQAIVENAGGSVRGLNGERIYYNATRDMRISGFYCSGKLPIDSLIPAMGGQ